MSDTSAGVSERCANCKDGLGYEAGWDDPPKGEGHIEVTWNPADEPSFVVGETRYYCSPACLLEDTDALPFSAPEDGTDDLSDTDNTRQEGEAR